MKIDHGNTPDKELFRLFTQGSNKAFEVIYARYFNVLVSISWKRLGSKEDAREMVQDLFVQLYTCRYQINSTHHLSGYLHTLLKNKMIDRFRKQVSMKKHHNYLKHTQPFCEQELPEAAMDKKKLEQAIQSLITALPEKCREVYLLSRNGHLSHRAIAERLCISVSTVEKHIGKALKLMRKQVEQHYL